MSHNDLFLHPGSAPPSCVIEELPGEGPGQPEQHEALQQRQDQLRQPEAQDRAGAESASEAVGGGCAGPTDSVPSSAQPPGEPQPAPSTSGSDETRDEAAAAATAAAEALKAEGNAAFGAGDWDGALQAYWQAIDAAPEDAAQERSVYYANAAACYIKKAEWQLAVEQCTAALGLNPAYLKALVRRSGALEALDDLEHALQDAQKVRELDPDNAWAATAVGRLAPAVEARQEKLKAEMLGKLKELGNGLLGKFGLSLDNFKAEQDPATGGYSIKFQQGSGS